MYAYVRQVGVTENANSTNHQSMSRCISSVWSAGKKTKRKSKLNNKKEDDMISISIFLQSPLRPTIVYF